MEKIYSWGWVETQVARTIEVWNESAWQPIEIGRRYSPDEQRKREQAYDAGLLAVEQEVQRGPRTKAAQIETQDRIVELFAEFSAAALDLEGEAIEWLTNDFLPVGKKLARWARQFDESLDMADIIQACRNAWTACGLQPLLGVPVEITPSILGYSLLYPYSDNYLDQEEVSVEAKLRFSKRFRSLLLGEDLAEPTHRESAMRALIELIENQYPRAAYPHVFDSLLAIHRAQEQSLGQLTITRPRNDDASELLRVSCGKGGSSVVADACLARDRLSEEENRFAFEWGALLQLGDDLQDVREDMSRGSVTLMSQAASQGRPLDELAIQLLNFSGIVGRRMDGLPHGTPALKELLKMSWRSLIVRAVADAREFFSPAFLKNLEGCSPFRFEFVRARHQRLAGRRGLYSMLFEAFLAAPGGCEERPDFGVSLRSRARSIS